eukprot:TCONS_00023208-protein
MYLRQNAVTSTCLIVIAILGIHSQVVLSDDIFTVIKVDRYMEKFIRNSFWLQSNVNTTQCKGRVCEKRNAYLTSGAGTLICQCQCKSQAVYSTTNDKCLSGNDEATGSFVLTTESNSSITIQKRIPFYSPTLLRSSGKANIRYCDQSGCVDKPVTGCILDWKDSFYDKKGWKRLWEDEDQVDFEVANQHQLMLKASTGRTYTGLLLKIGLSCDIKNEEEVKKSFVMFAMGGSYIVPPPTLTTTTSLSPATTPTTQSKTPSTSSKTFSTTTTTPSPATTLPTLSKTTLQKNQKLSTKETTKLTTTQQTSSKTTTILPTTKDQTSYSTTPSTNKSLIPLTTSKTATTTGLDNNTTRNTSKDTTVAPSDGKNSASHHTNTNNNDGDMNKKVLIIVSTVLGVFLFISCILVLCFYYRWKKAKKQRSNEHSMSIPSFFFQPETPVFLIGADGSHDKNKRSTTKDKKSQRASTTNSRRVATSDPNLYSTPVVTGREPKKAGSIRQIYASIDKFLKPSRHNKSNETLDEGYTTDDNYDYRRFAPFSKELYDEPGSIISSLDEPEYRIPEDFITSQMSVSRNNFESDYLSPHDVLTPPVKPPRIFSDRSRATVEANNVPENHYDQVGSTLNNQIQKMCHAYDEVGQVLQDKIALQDVGADTDDDYEEPHDSIRHIGAEKRKMTSEEVEIVQNIHAVDDQ